MKYGTSILKKMMAIVTLEEINRRIKEVKIIPNWYPQSQKDNAFTKQ